MGTLARRALLIVAGLLLGIRPSSAGHVPQDRSNDSLTAWVNVIGAEQAWTIDGSSVRTTGAPKGVLRTERQYENYVLEFEYRSSEPSGSAGLIVHGDALPAMGQPWPRGIDIQLEGDQAGPLIRPIADAMVEPVPADRAPSAARSSDAWTEARIVSRDGHIEIQLDGRPSASANYASPRKGYIALKSNGSPVEFRNVRLQQLPSTDPAPYEIASEDRGFSSLYDGSSLSAHWEMKPGHRGHWTANDWMIDYDGASEADDKSLWTKRPYEDFVLIADMRFTREPEPDSLPVVLPDGSDAVNADGSEKLVEVQYAGDSGIYVRGSSKNQINMGNRYIGSGEIYGYRVDEDMPAEVRRAVVPRVKADNPPGEWNRYVITMQGERITVKLNGQTVVKDARLPGIAETGRIALQDDHASGNRFQFGNLYIKELK